ncbi:MAG: hypothetical protein DRN04_19570 [Thermoprotei archaeon]|nr:MAG: hypothetical protein DRN04_19570 [Thermoprotei archaeon]
MQRKVQGIPRGSSYVYSLLASKILKSIYANVSDEVKSKVGIWGRVLDVGCGTGSLIVNILEKNKVYAIGLNISKAMIENAVKNISNIGEKNMKT